MIPNMTASALRKERPIQIFLPGLSPVAMAVQELSEAGIEERGAIFTRREVVDFILDLIGYVPTQALYNTRLLEPSFGHGDFLIPAVERLIAASRRRQPASVLDPEILRNAICAVELHRSSFEHTREKLREVLLGAGLTSAQSEMLLGAWLVQGDFLLTDFKNTFTHIIGNPPYIRQELIPDALITEYRRRYETIFDRADIYVPFIERSLELLNHKGVLGFICADRWMKNRYGGPLRKLIAEKYHLRTYIDMVDTPAFLSDVIAYPAITIIANEPAGPTSIARRPKIEAKALCRLAKCLNELHSTKGKGVKRIAALGRGDEPWVLDSSDSLTLVRRLEQSLPTLEEAGCKVGIGVATGADDAFIAPFEALDVEADRKLPLVMTRDIQSGEVVWRGYGIVNPFADDGKLVPLSQYPKLRAHFDLHGTAIKKRHISQKNPTNWYRTIDRIYPELTKKPKLLIPDIKGDAQVVYEDGHLYPHHNLYHILSDEWDLRALQAVLLSGIARLFVETYSTRMRGGFLRFQAQYLRRIRIPRWNAVSKELRYALRSAAIKRDIAACNEAVTALYGLSATERAVVSGT
jgi:hypothetical protein